MQNAIKITEGKLVTYLVSSHQHDYVSYEFKNGKMIAIDGGPCSGYIRRCGDLEIFNNPLIVENWALTEDSSFQDCCEKMLWGSHGKSGKEKLKYLPFKDLELSHLKAILKHNDKLKIKLSELQIKVINFWIATKPLKRAKSKI